MLTFLELQTLVNVDDTSDMGVAGMLTFPELIYSIILDKLIPNGDGY